MLPVPWVCIIRGGGGGNALGKCTSMARGNGRRSAHCPFTALSLSFAAFHCTSTVFRRLSLPFHCFLPPFTALSLSFAAFDRGFCCRPAAGTAVKGSEDLTCERGASSTETWFSATKPPRA